MSKGIVDLGPNAVRPLTDTLVSLVNAVQSKCQLLRQIVFVCTWLMFREMSVFCCVLSQRQVSTLKEVLGTVEKSGLLVKIACRMHRWLFWACKDTTIMTELTPHPQIPFQVVP